LFSIQKSDLVAPIDPEHRAVICFFRINILEGGLRLPNTAHSIQSDPVIILAALDIAQFIEYQSEEVIAPNKTFVSLIWNHEILLGDAFFCSQLASRLMAAYV
jgi:hypothetical protein